MEDTLVKMCEDIIAMLYTLRQTGKISESELKKHLKKKHEFLQLVKK